MSSSNNNPAQKRYDQRLLAGCGIFLIIALFAIAFGLVHIVKQDRTAVRYPGAIALSAHSNYKGLPRTYKWVDAFSTNDGFQEIYEWYSITFDMGAESRANGTCILLETTDEYFVVKRFMTVTICGGQQGQLVFIDRTTTFK